MLTDTGDMLEHIEGTKPVNIEAMRRIEQRGEQQRAQRPVKKGEPRIEWIGGGGTPKGFRQHGVGLAMGSVGEQQGVAAW